VIDRDVRRDCRRLLGVLRPDESLPRVDDVVSRELRAVVERLSLPEVELVDGSVVGDRVVLRELADRFELSGRVRHEPGIYLIRDGLRSVPFRPNVVERVGRRDGDVYDVVAVVVTAVVVTPVVGLQVTLVRTAGERRHARTARRNQKRPTSSTARFVPLRYRVHVVRAGFAHSKNLYITVQYNYIDIQE